MADENTQTQAEAPQNDLMAALEAIAERQDQMIDVLKEHDAKINQLAERPAPEQVATPEEVAEIVPQAPEGMTRFRSPHAEYRIIVEPRHPVAAGGHVLPANQPMIEFHGGIFDADEEQTKFLRAHNAHGVDYWEDPYATARSVNVHTGPRGAGRPAAPRRPEGTLVAPL